MNNPIINVLMKRDGMSMEEALSRYSDVKKLMLDAVDRGSYSEAEDILADELGLEVDYIYYII